MNPYNNNYDEYGEHRSPISLEDIGERQIADYLAGVMGWMVLGLAVTVGTAMLVLSSPPLMRAILRSEFLFYGILVAELAVVLIMSAAIRRIGAGVATALFLLYSALTGMTMFVLVLVFETGSILSIFGLTAALFGAMAVYGYATKRDLTRIGSLLTFGLFGLVGAMLFNLFLKSAALDYLLCAVGIVVFLGLTAYDTKRIKDIYVQAISSGYDADSPELRKAAIFGALTLYLDFINLFLKLLQLFGKRRR